MKTQQVDLSDLKLWAIVDKIRWFVQDMAFSKAEFVATSDGLLLLSSVEAVYLTDGVLTAFIKNNPPSDYFSRTLWLWGAIQALVVQQDAICHIGKALKKEPQKAETLCARSDNIKIIRNLRNRAAGHPVVDGAGKKFTFSAAHEGRTYSFLLFDNVKESSLEKIDIDVLDAINKQNVELSEIAEQWRLELMKEEDSFRNDHNNPLLQQISEWSRSFTYHASHLYPETAKLPLDSAKELKRLLDIVQNAFRDKGTLVGDAEAVIESMIYPVDELISYWEGVSHLKAVDVRIFVGFLLKKFEELKAVAKETDDEYGKRLR